MNSYFTCNSKEHYHNKKNIRYSKSFLNLFINNKTPKDKNNDLESMLVNGENKIKRKRNELNRNSNSFYLNKSSITIKQIKKILLIQDKINEDNIYKPQKVNTNTIVDELKKKSLIGNIQNKSIKNKLELLFNNISNHKKDNYDNYKYKYKENKENKIEIVDESNISNINKRIETKKREISLLLRSKSSTPKKIDMKKKLNIIKNKNITNSSGIRNSLINNIKRYKTNNFEHTRVKSKSIQRMDEMKNKYDLSRDSISKNKIKNLISQYDIENRINYKIKYLERHDIFPNYYARKIKDNLKKVHLSDNMVIINNIKKEFENNRKHIFNNGNNGSDKNLDEKDKDKDKDNILEENISIDELIY